MTGNDGPTSCMVCGLNYLYGGSTTLCSGVSLKERAKKLAAESKRKAKK